MRILQLSPCVCEYHAVFHDDDKDEDGNDQVFYVHVPQFGLVEERKGENSAGPLILLRNGALVPAWTTDGYIGCAPVEENDDEYWLEMWQELQDEEARSSRRKSGTRRKPKAKARTEPREVPPEDDEVEEEEDEDDDEPEGEVQLSGKRR